MATGSSSRAAVTAYTNETTFLSSNPIVSTETFDSFSTNYPLAQQSVTIDQVTYTDSESTPGWRVSVPLSLPHSNPNGLWHSQTLGPITVSFGAGNMTHAVGLWMEPFVTPNLFSIEVDETGGGTTTFAAPVNVGIGFYGFSSAEGIVQIIIEQTAAPPSGSTSNYMLDDVSRATIEPAPEPSTLLLMFCAVPVLLGLRRSPKHS